MAFTIKDIFPKLDVSPEDMTRHRMAVGLRARDSWMARYDGPPRKIEEDGYLANAYPDEFRPKATEIVNRYLAVLFAPPPASPTPPPVLIPQPETRKKRPRIKAKILKA